MKNYFYPLLAAVFIIAYGIIIYAQAGPVPTVIIPGSMIGGMILWLLTTYKRPADPKIILPIYLLTLVAFYMHLLEEHLFNFPHRLSLAAGINWIDFNFNLLILLIGPMIWVGAAVLLYYRNPFGNFIVWFFFFGMIIGEPSHFIFPLIEGGERYHYFPGMWTALLPLVTALYGMAWLVIDYRRASNKSIPTWARSSL